MAVESREGLLIEVGVVDRATPVLGQIKASITATVSEINKALGEPGKALGQGLAAASKSFGGGDALKGFNAELAKNEAAQKRMVEVANRARAARAAEATTIRDGMALLVLEGRELELIAAQRRAEALSIESTIRVRRALLGVQAQGGAGGRGASGAGPSGLGSLQTIIGSFGGSQLSGVASQAQAGATALEGLAAAFGVSTAALGAFAAAGAAVGVGALAIGQATREALALEAALRPVAARSQALADGMEGLRGEVRDLTVETGRSQEELGAGLAEAVQSGHASARQAVEILRVAADVALATGQSVPAAVAAVDSVLDAYSLRATQARDVSDLLLVATREGETSFGRMASAIQTAGVVASELGIPLEQTAAFLATVTRRSGNAEQAATQFAGALKKLSAENDPTRQKLVSLGAEISSFTLKAKGIPFVFSEIQRVAGDRKDILSDLFGGQRQATTFFAALSDTGGLDRTLAAIADRMDETAESAKRASTAGEDFAKVWAGVRQASGLDLIADQLLKTASGFAEFVIQFRKDHAVLSGILQGSLFGPLGFASAVDNYKRQIKTGFEGAQDEIAAQLAKGDVGVAQFVAAQEAANRYGDEITKATARIEELQAKQAELAKLPPLSRTRNVGRGEQVTDVFPQGLSGDESKELAALKARVASAKESLAKLFEPNIGKQFFDETTNRFRTLTAVAEDSAKHVALVWKDALIGPAAPELSLALPLKGKFERDLRDLVASLDALQLPATVEVEPSPGSISALRGTLQGLLDNAELTSIDSPSLGSDQQRAVDQAREIVKANRELATIQEQARLRTLTGVEREAQAQRDLTAQTLAKLDALRQALPLQSQGALLAAEAAVRDAQANDEAQRAGSLARDAAAARSQVLAIVAQNVGREADLAEAVGDTARAESLRLAAIEGAATAARLAANAELDRRIAAAGGSAEAIRTARDENAERLRAIDLDREAAVAARERAALQRDSSNAQAIAQARAGLLQGLDAELASIRLAGEERREQLRLEVLFGQTAEGVARRLIRLSKEKQAQDEEALRARAAEANRGELLRLEQDTARTYQEQLAVLGEIARTEEDRLVLQFTAQNASAADVQRLRELLALKREQAEIELEISEAQRSAVEDARRSLRGNFSGPEAFGAGLQAGLEDMQRYFADDFGLAVQTAQDALRTFRDSGVHNLEEVLDGAESLSDGLKDVAADFLKSIRHNLLEGLFNQLAGSLGGALGGLFGGGGQGFIGPPIALAQGGKVSGGTRPIYQAAGGFVAKSRTLLDVAELPGLQELIAPLDKGRLPVHVDDRGGMSVRVRGATVPVDLRGLESRGTHSRAGATDSPRGSSSPSVSIAPGAVVVQNTIHMPTVTRGGGPRSQAEIAAEGAAIARVIAADIENGGTRVLRDAIRRAAR